MPVNTSPVSNSAFAPSAPRLSTFPRQTLPKQLEQLYQERASRGEASPSLINYAAGLSIPLHSQHLYIICSGIVQLHTIHADGNETIVGLCGPSMVFGATLTHLHPYWATALSDTELLPLAIADVESSPALSAALLPQVIRRLQQSEAWLAFSGKRLVVNRLRCLILQLAQDFGQVGPNGVRITVRLTHHQLATIIGTTRVTVTRLLRDFKSEGWLKVYRRYLIVTPQSLGMPMAGEPIVHSA
ncbi:MAG: Crp/Fnr family transcriptional regulator [Cyanobacteria bacterium J06588_5]